MGTVVLTMSINNESITRTHNNIASPVVWRRLVLHWCVSRRILTDHYFLLETRFCFIECWILVDTRRMIHHFNQSYEKSFKYLKNSMHRKHIVFTFELNWVDFGLNITITQPNGNIRYWISSSEMHIKLASTQSGAEHNVGARRFKIQIALYTCNNISHLNISHLSS
jgi:hypothetical protein